MGELYSRCWANYDDTAFLETIALFEERFQLNRIDVGSIKGANCLDAGCGSGRYTFAMAKLGAKHSTGIDISERKAGKLYGDNVGLIPLRDLFAIVDTHEGDGPSYRERTGFRLAELLAPEFLKTVTQREHST